MIRINLFGDKMFEYRARNLQKRIINPMLVLNRIADDMMRVIDATFRSQGRRYGGSWHALSPSEVRQKAALRQDPRILIATGALRRAYTKRGDDHQQLIVTPSGITLDSDLAYAEVHQKGLGDMPKREFIHFDARDKARWTLMIKRDLAQAYRGGRAI